MTTVRRSMRLSSDSSSKLSMGDTSESLGTALPEFGSEEHRTYNDYSDEDRYIALAAVDLNGGNVYRTAKALRIPRSTVQGWVAEREERCARGAELPAEKEARGDLLAKVESLLHDIVEAAPAKLEKATFAQSMVGFGIGYDKVSKMRSQELESDPTEELCRLLGIQRSQLPDHLELDPNDPLTPGFGVIETAPNAEGILEPVSPNQRFHHLDFGPLQSAPNQADLPDGYMRLSDDAGNIFIFPTADLIPVENDGNSS